jgi:hypothetical protein
VAIDVARSDTLPLVSCIFISYSHGPDGAYVERLAAYLTNTGVPVWYDREIISGDRWESVIQSQIAACAAFIVVMTPDAEASSWVKREIARAEELGKVIVPLLLIGRPFFRLSDIQFEDVTGGRLPGPLFVDRLRALAAGPTVPLLRFVPAPAGIIASSADRIEDALRPISPSAWAYGLPVLLLLISGAFIVARLGGISALAPAMIGLILAIGIAVRRQAARRRRRLLEALIVRDRQHRHPPAG